MKVEELEKTLKEKGFSEESLDSGINYTKPVGHILLICYVEPGMVVEFIAQYRWKNNDVKGTHNISVAELRNTKDSIATLFRKTKQNMPQHIGEYVDTHESVDKVICDLFGEC